LANTGEGMSKVKIILIIPMAIDVNMKIERFRTFDGIKIRAFDKKNKALFTHCAGDSNCSSRDLKKVTEMLFIHGVAYVETVDDESV